MFHVEHFGEIEMKYLFLPLLLTLSLFLGGCNKPNPNPETLDPIYADLQKELATTRTLITGGEKELEKHEQELKAVVPQTGQIKYAQKRYFEVQTKLDKLKQKYQYLELRIKSREKWAKKEYMKAFKEKKPWPPPEEYEEYLAQKKLEEASETWDAKSRIERAKADLGSPGPKTESSH